MNPLVRLLALLALFLRPAVGEADADPADGKDPPEEDEQPELDLEAAPEGGEEHPEDEKKPEKDAELEEARREAKAERERAERYEREAAELRTRHAPKPDADLETAEEAKLRDPATPELEKWQIQANRALRQNTNAAQAALMQAADVRDQTQFAAVCMSDPLAKKYQGRVEEELAKQRAQGRYPTREGIYTYMLGKDMREGKFKKAAGKKPAADADAGKVNRGKLPGARSDVNARGAKSEREKRRERLENVQI